MSNGKDLKQESQDQNSSNGVEKLEKAANSQNPQQEELKQLEQLKALNHRVMHNGHFHPRSSTSPTGYTENGSRTANGSTTTTTTTTYATTNKNNQKDKRKHQNGNSFQNTGTRRSSQPYTSLSFSDPRNYPSIIQINNIPAGEKWKQIKYYIGSCIHHTNILEGMVLPYYQQPDPANSKSCLVLFKNPAVAQEAFYKLNGAPWGNNYLNVYYFGFVHEQCLPQGNVEQEQHEAGRSNQLYSSQYIDNPATAQIQESTSRRSSVGKPAAESEGTEKHTDSTQGENILQEQHLQGVAYPMQQPMFVYYPAPSENVRPTDAEKYSQTLETTPTRSSGQSERRPGSSKAQSWQPSAPVPFQLVPQFPLQTFPPVPFPSSQPMLTDTFTEQQQSSATAETANKTTGSTFLETNSENRGASKVESSTEQVQQHQSQYRAASTSGNNRSRASSRPLAAPFVPLLQPAYYDPQKNTPIHLAHASPKNAFSHTNELMPPANVAPGEGPVYQYVGAPPMGILHYPGMAPQYPFPLPHPSSPSAVSSGSSSSPMISRSADTHGLYFAPGFPMQQSPYYYPPLSPQQQQSLQQHYYAPHRQSPRSYGHGVQSAVFSPLQGPRGGNAGESAGRSGSVSSQEFSESSFRSQMDVRGMQYQLKLSNFPYDYKIRWKLLKDFIKDDCIGVRMQESLIVSGEKSGVEDTLVLGKRFSAQKYDLYVGIYKERLGDEDDVYVYDAKDVEQVLREEGPGIKLCVSEESSRSFKQSDIESSSLAQSHHFLKRERGEEGERKKDEQSGDKTTATDFIAERDPDVVVFKAILGFHEKELMDKVIAQLAVLHFIIPGCHLHCKVLSTQQL
ncbi:hypothetical protein ACO0QE_004523 [Hanseniaspora vineae]